MGYGEFEGYMKIGDFVGDGSIICIDRNYHVCCIFEGDAEITKCSLTELIERELEHLEEKIESTENEKRKITKSLYVNSSLQK